MKTILISIKKKYVEMILSGEKRFEFRTRVAKEAVNRLVIYCTAPTKKVVAEAEVIDVLKMSKEELWEITKDFSGSSKEDFMNYFSNSDIAYAYRLGKITIYDEAKELSDFGVKYPPQSFVYI